MRLLLFKEKAFMQERNKETTGSADIFSKDEKAVINEAENYISTMGKKSLRSAHYNYLMGIINYIKSDYRNAVLFFGKSLNENEYPERIYNEIISTVYENINDDDMLKKLSVKGGLVSEISSCFCMNYSNCTVLIDSCNRR